MRLRKGFHGRKHRRGRRAAGTEDLSRLGKSTRAPCSTHWLNQRNTDAAISAALQQPFRATT